MSHRKEQVESTLQRAITQVMLRSMSDPRIEGMVSIQRVKVSDDFKVADVYVSVLPDKFEKRTLAGLRAAAGHIHAKVFKSVAMRAVPRFEFQIDSALKREEAVFDAIAKAMDREGLDPSQVVHHLTPQVEEPEVNEDEIDDDDSDNPGPADETDGPAQALDANPDDEDDEAGNDELDGDDADDDDADDQEDDHPARDDK